MTCLHCDNPVDNVSPRIVWCWACISAFCCNARGRGCIHEDRRPWE